MRPFLAALGGGVAGELVRDHHPRRSALPLQEPTKQPLCGSGITVSLHQDVEYDVVLVDRLPEL
jgi:hypothetical protein